jgi:vancomycin resistance protein YoaR
METDFSNSPSRAGALVFWIKSTILKAGRAVADLRSGLLRLPMRSAAQLRRVAAESRTPLWREVDGPERPMEIGKVQNLRVALRTLDGTLVPAGEVFRFWRQIGRATARRGYVAGRQLREGCLYPAVGGGLCQLSNALYDLALRSGCEIVERHPHTSVVPGSLAEEGRDATVAWNYIDLRFRPATDLRIEAMLTSDELVVRFLIPETARVPGPNLHRARYR